MFHTKLCNLCHFKKTLQLTELLSVSGANVFEGDLGLSLSKLATNELHSNND